MKLTITDTRRSIECDFEKGEGLLSVIRRNITFNAPCGGRGFCGMCRIDLRKRNDADFKAELACFLMAEDGMIVRIKSIHRPEWMK